MRRALDVRTKYSKLMGVSRGLIEPDALSRLTHHRWALPAVAELSRLGGGAKFVQLVHRLGGHRLAVEQALDRLCELGLVMPNPGHGHPLRPEYVLTEAGAAGGPVCERVMRTLRAGGLEGVAGKKWALPTVLAARRGAETFGEMRTALARATDRALAEALSELGSAHVLSRRASTEDARRVIYALRTRGREIADVVSEIPIAV